VGSLLRRRLLPAAALAIALCALALAYRGGHPLQGYLFNSDSLYLPILFRDLFGHGGSITDWFLTPAPYFFPDYPLYGLAYLVSADIYDQIMVFGLLQAALTLAAIHALVRTALGRDRFAVSALTGVVLMWLSIRTAEPFVELLTSAYHFGAFLASLAFVALWLHRDRDDGPDAPRWVPACLCALSFVMCLSDGIFLVQTVAPFLASVMLLGPVRAAAGRTRRRLAGAVLASAVLGTLSYKLVVAHKTRYPTRLGLEQVGAHVRELGEHLGRVFADAPWFAVFFCAWIVFGLACVVWQARKRPFLALPRPLLLLVVFSTASSAATVVAVLLVKTFPVSPRYLIPVVAWPIVAGLPVLSQLIGRRFDLAALAAAPLLALVLANTALRLYQGRPDGPAGYYPEHIACIDKALASTAARRGVAQYWDAKQIQAFSRHPMTLAQYLGNLEQHKWITSERFYAAAYDFAIIDERADAMFKLSREKLVALNGEPQQVVSCASHTLLLYQPGGLRVDSRPVPAPTRSAADQAP
jgi:hypothetical protein